MKRKLALDEEGAGGFFFSSCDNGGGVSKQYCGVQTVVAAVM